MSRNQPIGSTSTWGRNFAFNILMERKSTLTSQAIEAVAGLFGANAERQFRQHTQADEALLEDNDEGHQLRLFEDEARLTEETKTQYPHIEATTIDARFLADDAYREVLKENIMFRVRCASRLNREEALILSRTESASTFHTTRFDKKR
jgi:hypothetical protein